MKTLERALARDIVTAHGGTITVTGLPAGGPGAAFEVRLPACGESPGDRRETYVGPALNFLRHASETWTSAIRTGTSMRGPTTPDSACPEVTPKKYLDWKLEDPAGRGVEAVRPIRDEIKARIEALIAEIAPAP